MFKLNFSKNEIADIKSKIYLSKDKNSILAKKYNVSRTNIIHIKKKRQWKWLTDTLD